MSISKVRNIQKSAKHQECEDTETYNKKLKRITEKELIERNYKIR
jgi:hypothetical protein